jgi:putative transposase
MRRRLLVPVGGGVGVTWSFRYLALRRSLGPILLCSRSAQAKEIQILVLRHELAVLRRQQRTVGGLQARPWMLAVLSRPLPRSRCSVFLLQPKTLPLRHRRMVGRRWTYPATRTGGPSLPDEIQQLIVRLARKNPRWATSASTASCCALSWRVSASSIRRILRVHGLDPAPRRGQTSWRSFLRQQANGSWPVTSSPSTRSCCGGCMCGLSSSLAAGGCTVPASPTIRPGCGSPSRPAICWPAQ